MPREPSPQARTQNPNPKLNYVRGVVSSGSWRAGETYLVQYSVLRKFLIEPDHDGKAGGLSPLGFGGFRELTHAF